MSLRFCLCLHPLLQFTIGYSRAYGTDKVFSEVPDFQGADAPWGGTDLTEGMDMQKEMIGGFHDDAPVHVMSQRARDIHHAAQAQVSLRLPKHANTALAARRGAMQ